ncbi:hypothetical protein NQ317_011852 [Molorchus minor]|uniref:Uncharacterized protein n=1 Tax=Molorchus minor TaxID=1323400 RepID=A0ABQ9JMH6_9CUCU|nr:hypothetical protein NQ317_011852 [Molorchus minor]
MKSKICKNYTYRFKINLVTVFGDICLRCEENMAAVPQGAFAAKKIRKNEEKRKEYNCEEFIPGTQTVEKNSFSTEVGSIGSPISFSPQNVYN